MRRLRKGCTLVSWIAILAAAGAGSAHAQEANIDVRADRVLHPVSRYLTGACIEDVNHEIYGGLYSQMIFGESFQEPPPAPRIEGFTSHGGVWAVRDEAAWIDGEDGPKLVSDHAPFGDGAAGVEVFFPDRGGQNAALLVHIARPAPGAEQFCGYEVALDAARQRLKFARHRNNDEPIQDVPCAVSVGRWVALEVRLAGPAIEVLVDGRSVLRHDDGKEALAAGTVALRPWHCRAGYRRLWVKAGADAPVETLPFRQLETPGPVSGMWRPVTRGGAVARFALVTDRPFAGARSQQVAFESGEGEVGVENQGLNRWGLNFVAGKPYEGYVWVRTDRPTALCAALESRDGARRYAEQALQTVETGDWQRLELALTPSAGDAAGRFTLSLKEPGSVTLGHAFLQPGPWGRFQGLPVRRDVAEAMIRQGLTVLRYGGSMVNHQGYRWKNMIGPRDRRPPYAGTWYRYSSHGWGIPDFLNFCEAAGFEAIPAFHMGETPRDMADFIDYARAPEDTDWGRRRAADGHPAPYPLHYIELGNEEKVDEAYVAKFEALAAAIWARDPQVILVVGDFAYAKPIVDPLHVDGAASRIRSLAAHRRILRFAKEHGREVWFDVHVWTDQPVQPNRDLDGMFSFADALGRLAEGARHRVVVFEYNSGNHAIRRALANALATQAIERDGRVPIVTTANGLQPDQQNDNGWDQGLLFLSPSKVWLQPPGYVTQMLSADHLPNLVACEVDAPGTILDTNAKRSEDGRVLVISVVNPGEKSTTARIAIAGFTPARSTAKVTELSGPPDAVNTAEAPETIVPRKSRWPHGLDGGGRTRYTFPPHSFTVLRFE